MDKSKLREAQETLEALARSHVGDHDSPLAFVTEAGNVVAVFVGPERDAPRRRAFIEAVIAYAATDSDDSAMMVEDCIGTVWENAEALRCGHGDDDDGGVPNASAPYPDDESGQP